MNTVPCKLTAPQKPFAAVKFKNTVFVLKPIEMKKKPLSHIIFLSCRTKLVQHNKCPEMFHPRFFNCSKYDTPRHLFLQWATAYFPLCARSNSPYMLIMSEWYLCSLQSFYRELGMSYWCWPVACVQQPDRGSNGNCRWQTAAMGLPRMLESMNSQYVGGIARPRCCLPFCLLFCRKTVFKHSVSLSEVIKIDRRTRKGKRFMGLVTSYKLCARGNCKLSLSWLTSPSTEW